MATWAQPAQLHPWFKTASLKRKLSFSPSPTSSSSPSPTSDDDAAREHVPAKKRQRVAALENGFAGLNLLHSRVPYPHQSTPSYPQRRPPSPNDLTPMELEDDIELAMPTTAPSVLDSDILRTTDVEEPTSPASTSSPPEVKMRTSSWYEPEKDRIIVTDLDASSSDEEDSSATGPTIAPALLARLRNQLPLTPSRPRAESDPSKALVLFRPLGLAGSVFSNVSSAPVIEEPPSPQTPPDDAMDVEL